MAAHRPGLRVFVLGVQGDEEGQAGADGLGHVPHGPDRRQPLLHQKVRREARRAQHRRKVRLRLCGGQILQRPPGGGQQHLRIPALDLADQGRALPLSHPAPGLEKVFQHHGEVLAVSPFLQGQKLLHPALGPGGGQAAPLGHPRQQGQQSPVNQFRQYGGVGGRLLQAPILPGLGQQLTGVPRSLGGGLPGLDSPGLKVRVLLRRLHQLFVPYPAAAALRHLIFRRGKKLPNQGVGPAPAL